VKHGCGAVGAEVNVADDPLLHQFPDLSGFPAQELGSVSVRRRTIGVVFQGDYQHGVDFL
jgi:hypothetical protein